MSYEKNHSFFLFRLPRENFSMKHESRKTIFTEELEQLKKQKFLDDADFRKVANAYEQYYEMILQEKKAEEERLYAERQASLEALKQRQEERKEEIRRQKEAKKLSPEQVRERNISLALIAGVVLLLLGGLVLATSSWEKMNHLLKVFSIGGVSLLFFGISYGARTYLKIEKTAFAFLTLASLLIPVTFIGIGYFQLFGQWLSLFGDGRHLLGVLAAATCFPVYTWISFRHRNRLFVWLTFITLTSIVAFSLAAFRVPSDFFYLWMIMYNGGLLLAYHFIKMKAKYEIWTKELPLFSQVNLIISTLFMLVFFQNYLVYSVNIIVTAIMYFAIVFVYNKKEFHYVFTLLLIYGMYQLFEHSFLAPFQYVGFALIGILYIVLEEKVSDGFLKKVFTVTSGIVSGLAFLYISFEGLVIRADENSISLLLAYGIIACNYIYLAHVSKRIVFQFLAPVFIVAVGYQGWNVLLITMNIFDLYMFAVGVAIFFGLYVKNSHPYLRSIQHSSYYVALATMVVSIFSSFYNGDYGHLSVLLLLLGFILIIVHEKNQSHKQGAKWFLPISWLLAFLFLYEQLVGFISSNVHLALSSLLLFGVSYLLRKYREPLFFPMFTVALVSYTLSLVSVWSVFNDSVVISSLYFVGIILYVIVVYEMKQERFWSLVAITTAVFLLSFIELFQLHFHYHQLIIYLFAVPVLLLVIYETVGRKVAAMKPYFFWTAQVFLLGFLVVSLGLAFWANLAPFAFFIPLAVYAYSIFQVEKEWAIKLFLYGAFACILVNIVLFSRYFQWQLTMEHSLVFMLLVIMAVWLAVTSTWKERTELFVIPAALLTLVAFFVSEQYDFGNLLLLAMTCALAIYLLFRRKKDMFSFIPLFLATAYVSEFGLQLERTTNVILIVVTIVVLHVVGLFLYKNLYRRFNQKSFQIDWFTIFTPIFFIQFLELISVNDPLWIKLLPSFLLVYLLFMQVKRVEETIAKNVVVTVTALASLLPYYIVLDHVTIPTLLDMEAKALPFLLLTIFLSKKTWQSYGKIMNIVQTVVLVIATLLIVADAIDSNTIYDAVIVGGLAITSIIGGMHYRVKSYFFVGIAVLLLNVFLQTKPFWGNLPWWMYLIFGGATLIGFASFYEWQKQRPKQEGKTLLQQKKEGFFKSFKEWK